MSRKTQIKLVLLIAAFVGLIVYTALGIADHLMSKALWCLGIWLVLGFFAQHESSRQKQ